MLSGQCLDRRIGEKETLETENQDVEGETQRGEGKGKLAIHQWARPHQTAPTLPIIIIMVWYE